MATRGREVLLGRLYYRSRKGSNGFKKKKVVGAFSGMGGSSTNGESSKTISAQILLFEDYEKVEKPGYKPKNAIKLEGAKIESTYSSPSASNTGSPAYGSAVTSPPNSMRLSASPSPSLSSSNSSELYTFTVATSNGDVHEFRTESENERLRWVKLLQLLVMYPYSPIPEEPKTNPIKDSFRQTLEAKQYGADSVWPVYILPEEVGSKSGILGLHILALRSGVPNVSMGQLDIISPSDHTHPVVTWDRDKMRRTGKTGNMVFIEIGRRCEGGPGLVWMYTGYQNDAQALRETLHKFLFHGDGRAVAMNSPPQGLYDVPPPSRSSVDSQSYSSQKRGSIPAGYSNHLLRSRSQDHDSGYHSIGSGRTPPTLDGPPVRLDKHPSIRRKRDSDPCLSRRSSSAQSPCSSFNERELSDPLSFECEDTTVPGHASHPDSPPDEGEGYVTGHMDGDSAEPSNRRVYDVVRERSNSHPHPYYTPQSTGTDAAGGDEYMCMIHPKSRNDSTYVVMRSASQGSLQPSSTIPVPVRAQSGPPGDHYNTLQHFPKQSGRIIDSQNYEMLPNKMLPTISERDRQSTRDNYENHPLPQEVKDLAPRTYRPSYENRHEASFRGRMGSHGHESYENVMSDAMSINCNENNNSRRRMQLQRQRSDAREDTCLRNSSTGNASPPPLPNRRQIIVDS